MNFCIGFSWTLLCIISFAACQEKYNSFRPGKLWLDNNGEHINAHGGGFLFRDGKYYWYGEHKGEGKTGNRAHVGVRVYSSTDLYNWTNEGIALKVVENDSTHDIAKGCIIERPKVIYNESDKMYVMWFHLELFGEKYKSARTAVAKSKSPIGPFKYLRSYRPHVKQWPMGFSDSLKNIKNFDTTAERWSERGQKEVAKGMFLVRDFNEGQMARDMTLFVDEDGKAYHIHASEENQTLHISELTDDYLDFTGKFSRVLPGKRNEAPAIIKRSGKYIMITSGLTGWKPNAARLSTADNIFGPWTSFDSPFLGEDADITFESQSTFILPVQGKEGQYIFMGDRWRPKSPIEGSYVWLPIEFENNLPVLRWNKEWNLNNFK